MHSSDLRSSKACLSAGVRSLRLYAGGLLLVLLVACGSAPVQEMSEARQAIEAARVAGAEQRATTHYRKAHAMLKQAEEMLNEGHYRKARESAEAARDEAIQAREAAQQTVAP
jgi:hypothetical protein